MAARPHHHQTSLLTPLTPSMPTCPPIAEQIEALPITPPDLVAGSFDERVFKPDSSIIQKALHVLATERNALAHLENLYRTSAEAQTALLGAISQIIHSETHHGKVIFTGIGKSGHIATKLAATFNSLGIQSACLHPTEALHGDLGMIRPNDTFIMITFSGRTPELLALISHIPSGVPLVLMTSHINPRTCPLLTHHTRAASKNFLLPTPIHESETSSFGISAPTTSTTITLALGDSLALAVADKLHTEFGLETPNVFAANHPGGAIGASLSQSAVSISTTLSSTSLSLMSSSLSSSSLSSATPSSTTTVLISSLATPVSSVPIAIPKASNSNSRTQQLRVLDVLLAAARSPSGFVRTSPHHMIGPRRIQKLHNPDQVVGDMLCDEDGKVAVERTDWISILGSTSVEEARSWVCSMRNEGNGRGREFLRRGTLLGIVVGNEVTGVVEIEEVVGEDLEQ